VDGSEIANVRADAVKDRGRSYPLIARNPSGSLGRALHLLANIPTSFANALRCALRSRAIIPQ